MNNKNVSKRLPKKFKNWGGGAGVDVTELQWAGWRTVIPPHCVDNLFAFEEGGDSVQNKFIYIFLTPSFPNIFLFILQKLSPPTVFIIEWWNKLHHVQD